MSPVVEILFVWVPILAAVVFVSWFLRRRIREGLTPMAALIDGKFMLVFFYSGALLSIYLATFQFFYSGFWPAEPRSAYIEIEPKVTIS